MSRALGSPCAAALAYHLMLQPMLGTPLGAGLPSSTASMAALKSWPTHSQHLSRTEWRKCTNLAQPVQGARTRSCKRSNKGLYKKLIQGATANSLYKELEKRHRYNFMYAWLHAS
eukprot:1137259-Pelagomonas_calceolata.AAC.3